jgi:hypothetical protein
MFMLLISCVPFGRYTVVNIKYVKGLIGPNEILIDADNEEWCLLGCYVMWLL